MKYALVIIWLVNGQVQGRVVREYTTENPQFPALYHCHSDLDKDRSGLGLACVPINANE